MEFGAGCRDEARDRLVVVSTQQESHWLLENQKTIWEPARGKRLDWSLVKDQ